jgi:uncharacterized RDD family membrane protein YckC
VGIYVPPKQSRPKSVSETLLEAEEEHYLDCPNADIWTRSAALILDAIFLFLLATGLKRMMGAVVLGPLFGQPNQVSRDVMVLISSIQIALQVMLFYFLDIWAVSYYGGSPAKLILGLQVINRTNGKRLNLAQAILREFIGKLILEPLSCGFGIILPLFRHDSRMLHDIISGSEVKKTRT